MVIHRSPSVGVADGPSSANGRDVTPWRHAGTTGIDPLTTMADDSRDDASRDARIDDDRAATAAVEKPRRKRRRWGLRILLFLVVLPLLLIVAWTAITLNYTYSTGDRAGYVQKFSNKGWLCKTWEGEIAMVTMPGTAPQIFPFTVRNDSVAAEIERLLGRRVSITYEEHPGIPFTCFGETKYFVNSVRPIGGPE